MNNNLSTWRFGIDNDKLVDLVIKGKKTATTSIYELDEISNGEEESILTYENGNKACIVKTKQVLIMKFNEMTLELARLEGEGDLSLNYWRKVHFDYFKSIDKNFNNESKIIFEIFEVVKIL